MNRRSSWIFMALACILLTGCGTLVHTTYSFPPPPTNSQRITAARAVDLAAAKIGFTDRTQAWRRSSPDGNDSIVRAYVKRHGRSYVIHMRAEIQRGALLILLYQNGHTKRPDFVATEAILESALQDAGSPTKMETWAAGIPM